MAESSSGPEPRAPRPRPSPAPLAWLGERVRLDRLLASFDDAVASSRPTAFSHLGGLCAMCVIVLAATGALLLTAYRPDPRDAHASVAAIARLAPWGWLVRGVHARAADALLVLAAVHAANTFASRAFRPPREITWLSGAALLGLVPLLHFSGSVLPWDDRSLLTATIGVRAVASLPVAGEALARLAFGATEPGPHTLQRFFALHVGAGAMLLAAAAAAHIGLVRAHGLTGAGSGDASAARTPVRAGRAFVVRSALAWIFAAPLLVAAGALVSPGLGAAADPLGPTPHGIHPSWIFLPLVQLLRVAPARIGPLPGLESVLCAVALLWLALAFAPFLSLGGTRGPGPKTARALAIGALAALGLLGAWGFLQR